MKVTILGSGSFFIDKAHSAPAYLIEIEKSKILFDCGPGTQVQLAKLGVDPLDIEYIFISHFHNDHTSDLLSFLMRAYIFEEFYEGTLVNTIKIIGPKGIHDFVRALANLQGHKGVVNFEKLEFIEYRENLDFEGFSVKPFRVEHLGMDAFALRLNAQGKVMVYSGDATLSEGIIKAIDKADLFITDCATPKDMMPTAHLGTTQVAGLCRDNGVKKVILSHQVPPGYNVDMVSEVKEVWNGDVILAEDLMEIVL